MSHSTSAAILVALLLGCVSCSKETAQLRSESAQIADELLTMTADTQGPIVVLTTSGSAFESPFTKELAADLQHAGKSKGKTIELASLPISPDIELSGQPVQKDGFLTLLGEKAEAGAVISLAGAPKISDEDLRGLSKFPPVFIASEYQMVYSAQLPKSLVKLIAVAGKPDATATNALEKRFRVLRKP